MDLTNTVVQNTSDTVPCLTV